jgi:hypothetical protein
MNEDRLTIQAALEVTSIVPKKSVVFSSIE